MTETTRSTFSEAARSGFEPPRDESGRFVKYKTSLPESALTVPNPDDASSGPDDDSASGVRGKLRAAREQFRARCRDLVANGWLPASSSDALTDPRTREGIDQFWTAHYALAEQAGTTDEGVYAVMPDDYTPAQTSGHALSGNRRTHRMSYSNDDVALRMPSATAIRRFAKDESGRTFDVPVDATYPGGSVSGYVRVTQNGPGTWSVSGLNMDPRANAYVAESVQAVLEARAVRSALRNVPDILERRAERLRSAGTAPKPVYHSDYIRAAGRNAASGDMAINLNGKVYGYRNVPPEVFARMMNPGREDRFAAGVVYNKLIKGKYQSFQVEQHVACGRFFEQGRPHRCPSMHQPRQEPQKQSRYQRSVRAVLGRFGQGERTDRQ